ncbi:MAG: hypothetical protein HC822_03865 [Oscillochloris sp.]|nr:hypothetical protein [Oscillochloris sp.]
MQAECDDFENGTLNQWQFNPGPVFTSLLLADEINRATPKTQAALLEAMAESQVTVLGRTYKLPNPFLVLATQNPIDQVGTYALPEAQADRFMFKILMPVPDKDIISQIMKKTHRIFVEDKAGVASSRRPLYIACNQHHTKGLPISDPEQEVIQRYTATRNRFRRHIAEVDQLGMPDNGQDDEDVRFVGLHEHVRQHIINLFLASNVRIQELSGIDTAQRRRAEVIGKLMVYGFGPRAVINLMRATRAWSLLFGSAQLPDAERIGDAEALAHVVIPILRHRIKLSFAWDEQYEDANRTTLRGVPATFAFQDDKLAALIAELCAVTAPSTADAAHYRTLFVTELRKVLGREATR